MPNVKVKYFGKIRELIGIKEEKYEVEKETTVGDMIQIHIPSRHKEVKEKWKSEMFRKLGDDFAVGKDGNPILRNYLVLVAGKSSNFDYILKDADEVAILPPAGGG